jgi:hypothetical protein
MARQHVTVSSELRDRLFWWSPLIVVVATCSTIFVSALGPSPSLFFMIGFPIIGVVGLASAAFTVASAVVLVRAVLHRAWRRAISASVLPLLIALVSCFPVAAHDLLQDAGDHLNWYVNRSHYIAILAARGPSEPRSIEIFDEEGMSFATSAVVYDESDSVSAPVEKVSGFWTGRCLNGANHLEVHFYRAYFGC